MKLTIITAFAAGALLFCDQVHAQESNFYIDLSGGYNMPMGGKSFMLTNYSSTRTDNEYYTEEEALPFSISKGFQFNVNMGYKFNKNLGVDLGLGYLLGTSNKGESYSYSANTFPEFNSYTYKDMYEWKSSFFKINPSLVFSIPGEKFSPYMKMGAEFGFGSVHSTTTSENTDVFGSLVTKNNVLEEAKFDKGLGFGITGALGGVYSFGSAFSVLGEVNFGTFSYKLKHHEVTKYEVDGVDALAGFQTYWKETNFVNRYVNDGSKPFNPDEPSEAASFNLPGSYLGLKLGVRYSF